MPKKRTEAWNEWVIQKMEEEREGILDYKDAVMDLRSFMRRRHSMGGNGDTKRFITKAVSILKEIIADEEKHLKMLEKIL